MTHAEIQSAVVALQPGESIDLGSTDLWLGPLLSHLRQANDCQYRRYVVEGRVIVMRLKRGARI